MPVRARLRDPASVFAALGDATRLGLVSRLSSGGPASISRLTNGSGVTRQAVTKHLRVLASAGLVRASRRGRESLWTLQPERLDEVQRSLDLIARQWDHGLGKLKVFVESPLAGGDAEARATRPRAGEQRRAPDRSD
ncbi:MAG: ArsR/SmtB family transcription factor [Gemmatimonadales bacterium]